MTKQKLYDIIVEYYEHIYRRVLRYNDYAFIPTKNQRKQINNFIDLLHKEIGIESIGKEWVWNYMIYLFKERSDQKARYKDKIPLNWIIGKKSYQLYQNKNPEWLYFNDVFINDNNISRSLLIEKMELKTSKYHEDLRAEYFKSEYPLHLCYNSVPYSGKSVYCMMCSSKKDCKEINE